VYYSTKSRYYAATAGGVKDVFSLYGNGFGILLNDMQIKVGQLQRLRFQQLLAAPLS
jgi:hypothetical protein